MHASIKIGDVYPNVGQIEGLPSNPRTIKDSSFYSLCDSIKKDKTFLKARGVLVYAIPEGYIIIGGEMRYRAALHIGMGELPCVVLPKNTTIEQLKEYSIIDNTHKGEFNFDALANEWDVKELKDWGVNVPSFIVDESVYQNEDKSGTPDNRVYGKNIQDNDIDFDNISSNENREVAQKIIICNCPNCNHTFNI